MRIRIMIIDDHPIVVNGLRSMLESNDVVEVLGSYHCEEAFMQEFQIYQPDVILECCRHGRTGDSLVRRIYKLDPGAKVLTLVSTGLALCVRNILKEERAGYILAKADLQEFLQAIETVYLGERFIDPILQDHFSIRKVASIATESLTKREREILDYVIKGYTNQQISSRLFLSIRTVENHRCRILQKMNVKNTAAMVKNAVETGLV